MKLKFRMNTADDKTELVQLWTEFAEWDKIDETVWEHRFGNAAIALAIDEATEKIVGQAIFIPTPVCLNGKEISAYRPFATFLIKEARSFQNLNPLSHPMFKMYKMATQTLKQQGVKLIQMMPDPLWGRMLRLAPEFQIAKFPLLSLKLPLENSFKVSDRFSVVEILPSDSRLDDLWEKSAQLYQFSAVRNQKVLAWKTSHHEHYFLGLECDGKLVAFAASRYKMRDKQWLICDIIAADIESFEAVIFAVCNQANKFKTENPTKVLDKIAVLATEMMLPILEKAKFYRDTYNFIFVIHRLDESLPKDEIAPNRWYVSAND